MSAIFDFLSSFILIVLLVFINSLMDLHHFIIFTILLFLYFVFDCLSFYYVKKSEKEV